MRDTTLYGSSLLVLKALLSPGIFHNTEEPTSNVLSLTLSAFSRFLLPLTVAASAADRHQQNTLEKNSLTFLIRMSRAI